MSDLAPSDNAPSAEQGTPTRAPLPKPIAGRIVVPGVQPGDVHAAVTLPPELRSDATATAAATAGDGKDARIRWSATATLCTVLAVGVLVAVERIGAPSGFRTFRYGVGLTALVLVLAAVASTFPATLWREGTLLAWNGLGLAIGALGLGVLGVSSMLALPPVLIGIALTAWPHPPASPDAGEPARGPLAFDPGQRAAFVSGLLVVPILALVEWLFLRGGKG
ncbi:MAG: hypothetical protein WBA46_10810 [Thermomicrobiales bacterium]